MKKSVLALAVLGTFAGAASAQGSVTLFGVVDLNVRRVSNDQTTYSLSQDGMASSRLGFRGVEDLGGGLKASFWLEGALGPDTGTGSGSYGSAITGATNPFAFQRRSTVSLTNQWGELRLGRDYTPQFWSWTVFDPFGTNGVGSATNLALQANATAGSGGGYGTLVRANNTVGYFLPNGGFGPGLYGQIMVAAGETSAANKMFGGRIGYAAGPFNVAAAYSDTDVTVDGSVSGSNWNIAGSWDFGMAKLSGFYSQIEISGGAFPTAGQDNWFIGVSAPFGQANLKFSYGSVEGTGNASSTRDATQWAIGADYNLSKRTAIYATYSAIDNKTGAAFRVAATTPNAAGNNSSGGEIGVRHSF